MYSAVGIKALLLNARGAQKATGFTEGQSRGEAYHTLAARAFKTHAYRAHSEERHSRARAPSKPVRSARGARYRTPHMGV